VHTAISLQRLDQRRAMTVDCGNHRGHHFLPWILMARTFEHILIFEYLIRIKNETRQLAMMR
jgi:hypothetical protein